MAISSSVKAVPMTSFNTTGLTTSYKVINASGLPEACFLLRIFNASDKPVSVSYDGSTDHDYVTNGGGLQIPFQDNANPNNSAANIKKKTKVYVKGAGAGTGLIYLSAYYQ